MIDDFKKILKNQGLDPKISYVSALSQEAYEKGDGVAYMNGAFIPLSRLRELEKDVFYQSAAPLYSENILLKSIELSITKDKALKDAIPFQIEHWLPYPREEAEVEQIMEKGKAKTAITFFACKKVALKDYLSQALFCNFLYPEPLALLAFYQHGYDQQKPCTLIHVKPESTVCILVSKGKIQAMRALPFSNDELLEKGMGEFKRTVLAFENQSHTTPKLLFTGIKLLSPFESQFQEVEPLPEGSWNEFGHEDAKERALEIGLCLCASNSKLRKVHFRKGESCKHISLERSLPLLKGLAICSSIFGLAILLIFMGIYHREELDARKNWQALQQHLAVLGVRSEHKTKPSSSTELVGAIKKVEQELKKIPTTYPLSPRIPLFSDVLAWLSAHPMLNTKGATPPLRLKSIDYELYKRPDVNKPREPYQVRVKLELLAPNPVLARAFYDSLQNPNPFVNPEHNIRWHLQKGKATVTFVAKDLTTYR